MRARILFLIYERRDGSEITRTANGRWYSTKESKSENAFPLPSWVHKQKPMRIIYTASNGKKYFTNDGFNWVRYKNTPIPSISTINDKQVIAKPLKNPIVFDKLNLKLEVSRSNMFYIIIYNVQTDVIFEETKELSYGLNNININTQNLTTGIYFYVITMEYRPITGFL